MLFALVRRSRILDARCDHSVRDRTAAGEVGRLAQLAERLVYTEKVGGSNPSSPSNVFKDLRTR